MNIEDYKNLIDRALIKYNAPLFNLQSNIYKSMNYSLEAGGKRLRPILLLEFYKLFGKADDKAMPFACAIEMIHTYSLIHDDLPAMDNDELRRGKPTNHVVFGEATAILSGDALLTRAFEIMSKCDIDNKEIVVNAISYMAQAAGSEGMIGGQIVDIESENKQIDIDVLKYIHRHKTGALLKAACVVGGILSEASQEKLEIVSDFAENLGVAFQIRDDILDVSGNEKDLGKPIGSDEKSNKCTYVSMFGMNEATRLCNEYTNKALECLNKLDGDTYLLKQLTKKLAVRSN